MRDRGYSDFELSGAISMLSEASPPGGRRGHEVTKSRNLLRSLLVMSHSSSRKIWYGLQSLVNF